MKNLNIVNGICCAFIMMSVVLSSVSIAGITPNSNVMYEQPIAIFTWSPEWPYVNTTITFNAGASYDPDGYIIAYSWDFTGDGYPDRTGMVVKWYWKTEGNHPVRLAICDNERFSNGTTKVVRVLKSTPVAEFQYTPEHPTVGQIVTLDASLSFDPDNSIAWYAWDYDNDPYWDTVGGPEDIIVTYSWDTIGTYEITLEVEDIDGHTDTINKTLVVSMNTPPDTPSVPVGPTNGKIGVSYEYRSSTTDQNEDQIYYWFDWGDGTNTGWIGPFQSGVLTHASHLWSAEGVYLVKVKAKDVFDAESDWSLPHSITIVVNRAPHIPLKPSGSTRGKIGTEYSYTSSTTDPDGDQLYYLWDWGDGETSDWLGPYDSGDIASASHSWEEKGNYQIRVKAKDIDGDESGWSDSLPIAMPYLKTQNPFFLLIYERLTERLPFLQNI